MQQQTTRRGGKRHKGPYARPSHHPPIPTAPPSKPQIDLLLTCSPGSVLEASEYINHGLFGSQKVRMVPWSPNERPREVERPV